MDKKTVWIPFDYESWDDATRNGIGRVTGLRTRLGGDDYSRRNYGNVDLIDHLSNVEGDLAGVVSLESGQFLIFYREDGTPRESFTTDRIGIEGLELEMRIEIYEGWVLINPFDGTTASPEIYKSRDDAERARLEANEMHHSGVVIAKLTFEEDEQ